MNRRKKISLAPDRVEWFLIGVAAIMFLLGAVLLIWSPAWWGWYLRILMPSYWWFRGWLIAGAVLVEIVLLVRFLGRRSGKEMPHESGRANTIKQLVASGVLLAAILSIIESTVPGAEVFSLHWYGLGLSKFWTSVWWVKAIAFSILTGIAVLVWWIRARALLHAAIVSKEAGS